MAREFNGESSHCGVTILNIRKEFHWSQLVENNNFYQLIDEPTKLQGGGISYIDLIITGQPNMFIEPGVHPSLDDKC